LHRVWVKKSAAASANKQFRPFPGTNAMIFPRPDHDFKHSSETALQPFGALYV
jgi:hypothetical protein